MASVLEVIENKELDLDQSPVYAAIVGESPSRGARSPSLWNAAFRGLSLPGLMHPMDIKEQRLAETVKRLKADARFIGGAVTMPFKRSILPYLDELEEEARTIGAVNSLYRREGRLVGANTDGAGALWNLERAIGGTLSGAEALLVGTGGAGFAVATYLASALGRTGRLLLVNRTRGHAEPLARRLEGRCPVKVAEWPLSFDHLEAKDLLVNCTSIGFETMKGDERGFFSHKWYMPLATIDDSIRVKEEENAAKQYLRAAADAITTNLGRSLQVLSALEPRLVFDIIYQPPQTPLLFFAGLMGCRTLNGFGMNLEQAVIAFDKATAGSGLRGEDREEVRRLMGKV